MRLETRKRGYEDGSRRLTPRFSEVFNADEEEETVSTVYQFGLYALRETVETVSTLETIWFTSLKRGVTTHRRREQSRTV